MQCFDEAGNLIRDAHIECLLNEANPNIIDRVAVVEGETFNIGQIQANAYIQELSEPFWINDADHLYLNADYQYGVQLHHWMTDYIIARLDGRAAFETIPLRPAALASTGLQLSEAQLRAFQDGRPLWRRSLFSCDPGPGTDGQSTISRQLRDALLCWVVISEMMARHALQIDGKRKHSQFANNTKGELSALAQTVIEQALGYETGGETLYQIKSSELGVEELFLATSAHQYKAAHDGGRAKYFKRLFSRPPKELTKLLKTELHAFEKRARPFGAKFDAKALVEWAAKILIYLRIALTASLELDAKRDEERKDILSNVDQAERERLARLFMEKWLRGIRGRDSTDKKSRDIALEDILDLQMTALIAFAGAVKPGMLFPYINTGIYDKYDHDTLLPTQLFAGAIWLGDFYRKRYSHLDCHQAQAIVAFCNPDCLPRGLPQERQDEWNTATRLIVSFLTKKGLASLMDGANAVLNDGETRSVVAFEKPQSRAERKRHRKTRARVAARKRRRRGGRPMLEDQSSFIAPPIVVEAGWLLLPGDYREAWFERCDPFTSE